MDVFPCLLVATFSKKSSCIYQLTLAISTCTFFISLEFQLNKNGKRKVCRFLRAGGISNSTHGVWLNFTSSLKRVTELLSHCTSCISSISSNCNNIPVKSLFPNQSILKTKSKFKLKGFHLNGSPQMNLSVQKLGSWAIKHKGVLKWLWFWLNNLNHSSKLVTFYKWGRNTISSWVYK